MVRQSLTFSSKRLTWLVVAAAVAQFVSVPSDAQFSTAEAFYRTNIDDIVQQVCIACHSDSGVARGSSLIFVDSQTVNHAVFESYIGASDPSAVGAFILSTITGGEGHRGGAVVSANSAEYRAFEQYIVLITNETVSEPESVFRVSLEEPLDGGVHTGVGNLRGWAVASTGILNVEVWIDGVYVFDAPYGGARNDVGDAFEDVSNADNSGFSLAFNYSELAAGEHTITVVAHSVLGASEARSATFHVVKFGSNFISGPTAVSLNAATCSLSGDQVSISNGAVDGGTFDFLMVWRTAEQGFEIVEIR